MIPIRWQVVCFVAGVVIFLVITRFCLLAGILFFIFISKSSEKVIGLIYKEMLMFVHNTICQEGQIIFIIIFLLFWEFFTTALADDFSLDPKWQQVYFNQ